MIKYIHATVCDVYEVTELLGVSRQRVEQLVEEGKLKRLLRGWYDYDQVVDYKWNRKGE